MTHSNSEKIKEIIKVIEAQSEALTILARAEEDDDIGEALFKESLKLSGIVGALGALGVYTAEETV